MSAVLATSGVIHGASPELIVACKRCTEFNEFSATGSFRRTLLERVKKWSEPLLDIYLLFTSLQVKPLISEFA